MGSKLQEGIIIIKGHDHFPFDNVETIERWDGDESNSEKLRDESVTTMIIMGMCERERCVERWDPPFIQLFNTILNTLRRQHARKEMMKARKEPQFFVEKPACLNQQVLKYIYYKLQTHTGRKFLNFSIQFFIMYTHFMEKKGQTKGRRHLISFFAEEVV